MLWDSFVDAISFQSWARWFFLIRSHHFWKLLRIFVSDFWIIFSRNLLIVLNSRLIYIYSVCAYIYINIIHTQRRLIEDYISYISHWLFHLDFLHVLKKAVVFVFGVFCGWFVSSLLFLKALEYIWNFWFSIPRLRLLIKGNTFRLIVVHSSNIWKSLLNEIRRH